MSKIGKGKQLGNITDAMWVLKQAAEETVMALKQKFSDDWKKSAVGGKLEEWQKEKLQGDLITITLSKLAGPVVELIKAAGIDIEIAIVDAGEAKLKRLEIGDDEITIGIPIEPDEDDPPLRDTSVPKTKA